MHNRNKNALLGLLLASCSAPLAAQVISLESMEISSAPIEDAVQRPRGKTQCEQFENGDRGRAT